MNNMLLRFDQDITSSFPTCKMCEKQHKLVNLNYFINFPEQFELHRAVWENDIEKVEQLLGQGFDPNQKNRHGNTPLYLARDCPTMTLFLILNGAVVHENIIDDFCTKNVAVILLWLENGAVYKNKVERSMDSTALSCAKRSGNTEMVNFLMDIEKYTE